MPGPFWSRIPRWFQRMPEIDRLSFTRRHRILAMISIRHAKLVVLTSIALFFALVVFNNITDFESNHWCVRTVLGMKGIRSKEVLYRSIQSAILIKLAYLFGKLFQLAVPSDSMG